MEQNHVQIIYSEQLYQLYKFTKKTWIKNKKYNYFYINFESGK